MDSIELARQHARRLHDEAVKRGQDPWSPYQFVSGIAKHLGICVQSCAPGATMLDGGQAFFALRSLPSSMKQQEVHSTKRFW